MTPTNAPVHEEVAPEVLLHPSEMSRGRRWVATLLRSRELSILVVLLVVVTVFLLLQNGLGVAAAIGLDMNPLIGLLAGTVTMSAKDHLGLDLGSFRMLEIRNGGWTLVK